MKKVLIILSFLILGISNYSQAQRDRRETSPSFTITNGFPGSLHSNCSYTVNVDITFLWLGAPCMNRQTATITPGQSHTFNFLLSSDKTYVCAQFSASTTNFSQNDMSQTTQMVYEGSCQGAGGYVTFWHPLGNNTFHIYSSISLGEKK